MSPAIRRCKVCGHPIPSGARYCEHCGVSLEHVPQPEKDRYATLPEPEYTQEDIRRQVLRRIDPANKKARQKIRHIVGLMLSFLMVFEVFHVLVTSEIKNFYNSYQPDSPVLYSSDIVNASDYKRLEIGMSSDEVEMWLGSDRFMEDSSLWEYEGEYGERIKSVWLSSENTDSVTPAALVTISFDEDMKVSYFAEVNVLDGEEIVANLESGRTARTDKTYDSIPDTFSISEMEKIFGCEGVLVDSWSASDGASKKVYRFIDGNGDPMHIAFVNGSYSR